MIFDHIQNIGNYSFLNAPVVRALEIIRNTDFAALEDGTYEELIAKGGKFAELVERQRLDV